MNPIKAIIFDMDGVLVDSEPFHVKIEKALFKRLQLDVSDEEHATYMGKASDVMWHEIRKKHQLDISLEEAIRLNELESEQFFGSLKSFDPIEGLVAVLNLLRKKQIPLAVASSSSHKTIQILMDKTGLRKYFQQIVSSKMAGKSKPDPAIFLLAASLLKVAPENCLVIEDSTNGIRAAKAAGMYCMAYDGVSAGNQDQRLADQQIKDYRELFQMIERNFI